LAARAAPNQSTRLFGQFHPFGCSAAASWVSISLADRDLIVPKSADLDVFPGMRLTRFAIPDGGNCLARA